MRGLFFLLSVVLLSWLGCPIRAATMDRDRLSEFISAPYALGTETDANGVWPLLNAGGLPAGYVFETEPLAPLPGFSGAPINLLVVLDLEGTFIDVRLINHNEPIFVSGLGQAPFHRFFEQYGGLSISSSIVIGTPYGAGGQGALTYLDGVTKATASVRIAHESIMAAARAVAREKMQGLSAGPPVFPDTAHDETLDWDALIAEGLVTRKTVSNAEVDAAFAGTLWEDDDPDARAAPDAPYLDLWIVDVGPQSIARAVLTGDSVDELRRFMEISAHDEPILLIETARHGLVSDDFVRNTAPDWISARQDGLPIALRDADLTVELAPGLPEGTAMILRTDRRLGLDPTRDWTLDVLVQRQHGVFRPEIGAATFSATHRTDDRFFSRPAHAAPAPPWLDALRNRQSDLIVLGIFLTGLLAVLGLAMHALAGARSFTPVRLGVLAVVTGFIGWWGQGQLSIVTALGALRTGLDGGSFAFLLYDPFSLMIWIAALVGLVIWGRGLFCGWLCPFGALQEFAHHIGRTLRLPQWTLSRRWDRRVKRIKYVLLAGLVATVAVAPDHVDTVAEVEPFKTAITTFFIRDWYYVLYAGFWLGLGLFTFKGFCRYVCPLGALLAVGGLLCRRNWIPRRADCGSPCQFCTVKCKYGAIEKTGQVVYSECFQCLDCVTIHDDVTQCVPLVLANRRPDPTRSPA